ncbi:MAG TPA: multifunctional oxoglutarate decarboxylase/oxoglutarate dehydrogenase thiamine pyrophosphate-binding subunit/dihydrolipoyllysine-residue succinyltransferase subunit [Terriglobales bacterium]|nr:multifunctional oxoglutarate decarboxylase/oxoglutarate dehydrogenase thiamine pyrophosphate-binding subunit/dihydrolipoyllysine-residue succinyltransferase subunit [Terriglobales bacterium]
MPSSPEPDPQVHAFLESLGANEGYAEELYRAYRSNRQAVPERWRAIFDDLMRRLASPEPGPNGHSPASQGPGLALEAPPAAPAAYAPAVPSVAASALAIAPLPGDQLVALRGAALRLAGNMQASIIVPTATSQRTIPVRLLEENRRLLNRHLASQGIKLSMTPLLGWAIVQGLAEFPALNAAYSEIEGIPARIERAHVNLGLAVDVAGKNGGRNLLVPVVKGAESMDFAAFLRECDRLIQGARAGKLLPEDLQGATISLTNPGTIGTRASVPRLMPGQGAIVAAGAVAFPAGFEAVPEATLESLGIGKTLTLTCTYDHRIIQGAESGTFLARLHAFLLGEDRFYDEIFRALGVPFQPARWTAAAQTPAAETTRRGEDAEVRKQAAVFQLVHAYRVRGHLLANTDPLEFHPIEHAELDPSHYGLSLWDLDRHFLSSLSGAAGERMLALREILEVLRATYCGTLACEFMHLQAPEERHWLTEQMEPSRNQWPLPAELRLRILRGLTEAEGFEHLLHTRYVGHKRFSLEGAEALIPALDFIANRASASGMKEMLIGMAHRGRLNVLTNIVGQPMNAIFSKFEDADPDSVEGSGDVKYHIGASGVHRGPQGEEIQVSLSPNPSHLEAVDPVLEGSARARQEQLADVGRGQRVLPVLIHGDAAFAGEGIVAETLNLSQLEGYRTGGTVHIVINNRIGFTTSPADARSTLYSTDVARMVQAPIWHVNGDDPEAVIRAADLAFRFRQEFHKDVVVDLVCYRRHGHNEGDDPSLTQPVLYRNIDQHPSVRTLYAGHLTAEGLIASQQVDEMAAEVRQQFTSSSAEAGEAHEPAQETAAAPPEVETAASEADLAEVGEALATLPQGFTLHPKLKTFVEKRHEAVRSRAKVDWSLAEALAFGTLLLQGVPIRLTGQDTGRGTFSQRHAVLYDYQTGAPYVPLAHVPGARAAFAVHDSLLSEAAALGFEFGYALRAPTSLVLWEAQFGDFSNGAQVIIDQFIAASAAKWGLPSGLVLLLPHGYEGQGPEHSSARLERFLQLAAEDNLQVANTTTAAQYFHLLRRQALRQATAPASRRPLVIMTPKSLLRYPPVASPFAEFVAGSFRTVLGDESVADGTARRLLFCSGKVYYDLLKRRGERGDRTTALVRVEQLYPFPEDAIQAELQRQPQAADILWVQEEPANMGAWSYIRNRLEPLLGGRPLAYVGREPAASPATGSLRRHLREQTRILDLAFPG